VKSVSEIFSDTDFTDYTDFNFQFSIFNLSSVRVDVRSAVVAVVFVFGAFGMIVVNIDKAYRYRTHAAGGEKHSLTPTLSKGEGEGE
jgi:hypothetical protein